MEAQEFCHSAAPIDGSIYSSHAGSLELAIHSFLLGIHCTFPVELVVKLRRRALRKAKK